MKRLPNAKAYVKQGFNFELYVLHRSNVKQWDHTCTFPSHSQDEYSSKFGVYLGSETSGNQSQVSQWNPARIKTATVGYNQCSETVLNVKVAYMCTNVSDSGLDPGFSKKGALVYGSGAFLGGPLSSVIYCT